MVKFKRKRRTLSQQIGITLIYIGLAMMIITSLGQVQAREGIAFRAMNAIDGVYAIRFIPVGYANVVPSLEVKKDFFGKQANIRFEKPVVYLFKENTLVAVLDGETISKTYKIQANPGEEIILFYSRIKPIAVPNYPGVIPSFWDEKSQIGGYIINVLGRQEFRNPLKDIEVN